MRAEGAAFEAGERAGRREGFEAAEHRNDRDCDHWNKCCQGQGGIAGQLQDIQQDLAQGNIGDAKRDIHRVEKELFGF